MGKKLRPRHYFVLVLFAIIAIETTAIAIDRLFGEVNATAFDITGQFKNNAFEKKFSLDEPKSNLIYSKAPSPTVSTTEDDHSLTIVKQVNKMVSQVHPKVEKPSRINRGAAVSEIPSKPEILLASTENFVDYQVRKGDSVAQVAKTFNADQAQIRQANGILENVSLRAGQKLRIPVSIDRMAYSVKEGDSLSKIAAKFSIPLQDIIQINDLKNSFLLEGQKITIPLGSSWKKLQIVKSENSSEPLRKDLVIIPSTQSEIPKLKNSSKLEMVKIEPIKMVSLATKLSTKEVSPRENKEHSVKIENEKKDLKNKPAQEIKILKSLEKSEAQEEIRIVSHTVKRGENISKIARDYHTSISQIIENNRSGVKIHAGQKLQVPVNKRMFRVLQITSRRAEVNLGKVIAPQKGIHSERTGLFAPVRGNLTDRYGWRYHPVRH
ncbi:LysM peptidoglycan-binding domain-containing protein, partial [bacterium]|nr:LysM peptidoglycan-binding domain-containing protein [bacterium]